MKMNDNYGLIVHPEDFDEITERMTDAEAGFLFKSMVKTFKGESITLPDDRYLSLAVSKLCGRVKRECEISEKRSNSGKKGGAPVGNNNANKQKTSKKQAKDKQNSSKNKLQIPNTNIPNTNINKRPYGECANVYLTEEEHSKIVNEGLTGLIEELSLYIASKGDKYKSHYAVIKQWAMRRKREQAEKEKPKSNQFTQGVMSRDIDFADLEKKLIKN